MLTERQKIANALIKWSNSFSNFDSNLLSSIGIDDTGDLADESEAFWNHMNRFFNLVYDIEKGKFASPR